tara:strand:- start:603 stop:1721 length:1119 start_codon:yes stop_codon:yes gene_type:complete
MDNPKIIAVIPVYGRELLLPFTINRLYNKNKLFKVICCGNLETDKKICLENNAEWVQVENKPLGNKWNKGFYEAKKYSPDAILFVGSSDWISENWIPLNYKYLPEYGMVGKKDFTMVDIPVNDPTSFCHWKGYPNNHRSGEPIGIGRLISRKFLEKIKYKPFKNDADDSMDYYMYKICLEQGEKVKLINSDDSFFLSLSTNAWINKHIYTDHFVASRIKTQCFEKMSKYCLDNKIKSKGVILLVLYYYYISFNTLYTSVYTTAYSLNSKKKKNLVTEFPELKSFIKNIKNLEKFHESEIKIDWANTLYLYNKIINSHTRPVLDRWTNKLCLNIFRCVNIIFTKLIINDQLKIKNNVLITNTKEIIIKMNNYL